MTMTTTMTPSRTRLLIIVVAVLLGYGAGWLSFGRGGSSPEPYAGVVTSVTGRANAGCVVPLTGASDTGDFCGYLVGDEVLISHLQQGQHVHAVKQLMSDVTVLVITP
jgi:hypothetical protein